MTCPEVTQMIQRLIWDHGPHALLRQFMSFGVKLGTVGHLPFSAAPVSPSAALLSDGLIAMDGSKCLWVASRDLLLLCRFAHCGAVGEISGISERRSTRPVIWDE